MARAISQVSIVLPSGATAEVKGPAISPNKGIHSGLLALVKVVTPTFTNNITVTIKMYDRNGILLWTSAALAETSGTTGYALPVSIPINLQEYFSATPSGDPGSGGGTVTINADYIPDHYIPLQGGAV